MIFTVSCAVIPATPQPEYTRIEMRDPSVKVQARSVLVKTAGGNFGNKYYFKITGFDSTKYDSVVLKYRLTNCEFRHSGGKHYFVWHKVTINNIVLNMEYYHDLIHSTNCGVIGSNFSARPIGDLVSREVLDDGSVLIGKYHEGIFKEGFKIKPNKKVYLVHGKDQVERSIFNPSGNFSVVSDFEYYATEAGTAEVARYRKATGVSMIHYTKSKADTELHIEKLARTRTIEDFKEELESEIADDIQFISHLEGQVDALKKEVASSDFKKLKASIDLGGYSSEKINCWKVYPLFLDPSYSSLPEHERETKLRRHRQFKEKRDNERSLWKQACLLHLELLDSIDISGVNSFADLMNISDLSGLTKNGHHELVDMIIAYRKLKRTKLIFAKAVPALKKKKSAIITVQESKRRAAIKENTAKIEKERQAKAVEIINYELATQKCWKAYGWPPYHEWGSGENARGWPEGEPCQNSDIVKKYL